MIACTTSNTYHSINPAIRSRTHLFELEALKPDDISIVVKRALTDESEGYGHENINLSDDALRHFSESANGDLRAALNGLELAVSSTPPNENNEKNITRSEEHTSELQSRGHLVCRLLLEKKKKIQNTRTQ